MSRGKKGSRLLGALLLCTVALGTQARLPGLPMWHYHVASWGVIQGLGQQTVEAVVQDPEGYIWAGTEFGLFRFDGVRFKGFYSDQYPGLASNFIQALLVDGPRLWIGTTRGLSMLQNGKFKAFHDAQPQTGSIFGLARSNHAVWVAASRGLFKVVAGKFTRIPLPGQVAMSSVAVDSDGGVWAGTRSGAWYRTPGQTRFAFKPLKDAGQTVTAIADWHGTAWLGTSTGNLYRVDAGKVPELDRAMHGKYVRVLLAGPRGGLWLGTNGGLFRLAHDGKLENFTTLDGMQHSWIFSLAADREGNIWVGTALQGLIRLWDNNIASLGKTAGLPPDTAVWPIMQEPDGRIWMGTTRGVYEFVDNHFEPRFDSSKLPAPLALSFLRVGDDLWIGTRAGLAMARNGKLVALPKALRKLPPAMIYNLTHAIGGGVWIGTSEGLYHYANDTLRRVGKGQLPDVKIRVVRQYDKDTLWVATDEGLYRGHDGRFTHIGGNTIVSAITRSRDGSIWFGRVDSGLGRYHNGKLTRYGFKDGLPRAMPFGLVTDGEGDLWVTTHKNVYRLRISTVDRFDAGKIPKLSVRPFSTAGSLYEHGCNGGGADTALLDEHRDLWCPSTNGVIVVDTHAADHNRVPPPMVIERVNVDGHTHRIESPESGQQLVVLPAGSKNVQISYAGLSFEDPERVSFRYRLLGHATGWLAAGKRRDAFYTNLGPGAYTFEVEARNNSGVWSTRPARLALIIEPFFWQTWWFSTICALAILLLLYLAYLWRTRHARATRIALETTVARRTADLAHANQQLKSTSLTDALTGMNNRRYLAEHIDRDIALLRRRHAEVPAEGAGGMAFIMLDIDDFKNINDRFGHLAGDRLLVEIARVLAGEMRGSDYMVRWGGEEFLGVAWQARPEQAAEKAERLRAAVDREYDLGGGLVLACSCSIGFCNYPLGPGNFDKPDWESAIALADIALYKAKTDGKNTWIGLVGTAKTDGAVVMSRVHDDLDGLIADGELVIIRPPGHDAFTA